MSRRETKRNPVANGLAVRNCNRVLALKRSDWTRLEASRPETKRNVIRRRNGLVIRNDRRVLVATRREQMRLETKRGETTRNETHPTANDLAIRNGSGVLVTMRSDPT